MSFEKIFFGTTGHFIGSLQIAFFMCKDILCWDCAIVLHDSSAHIDDYFQFHRQFRSTQSKSIVKCCLLSSTSF